MANKWTPEQQKAIYSTGGTVLVAAAAGSGKTSVLVERVIQRITNESNPIDLDKFLIVTFTNAAAQEMKDRISESLSKLLLKDPKNLNLHRQQMLLKCSSIGTIHSFCNTLVKENFFKLGISPNFRIADESELLILNEKALENTFDHFYTSNNSEFSNLLDIFGNEKNTDKLSEIISTINNFANSIPFPEKWFNEKLELYNSNDFNSNIWIKTILEHTKKSIHFALKLISKSLIIINEHEALKKSYVDTFEEDMTKLKCISDNVEFKSWNEICEQINNFSFSRLKPCRSKECEEQKNIIVSNRNYIKDIVSDIKKYFNFTYEDVNNNLLELYPIIKMIFDTTIYFREEVERLKLSKNIIDFNDLERMTLKLLFEDKDTLTKSKIAEEISEKYVEVMIDEYQDINEVQNTIFKLITKNESNVFMVGDVKQSIYKFRQSRPQIFLSKKNIYPLYDESNINYPSKIILDRNFRSKKSIIDTINLIFECLMSTGEVPYTQEEKLTYGANYPDINEKDISVKFIDTSEIEEKEDEDILEAQEIAKTIMEMISSGYKIYKGDSCRLATYSDFCVLLRSSNSHAHIYSRELNLCGIPSFSETNDKFLTTSEISTILSLLKVIDNPIDDIPLISCLISPLFGFSIDDLSNIRQTQKDIPFYFALKKYFENHNDSEHIKNFVNKIEYYRRMTGTMSSSELIDCIYQDTDYPYMCLALPNGNIKKANLFLFKDYAKKFDDEYGKGLSGFLKFISNIERKNSDLPSASISSETENTVKIMSIHKSKGLEFPICIVAGCSRKFVKDNDSVILHPELGIAMKSKNSEGTVKYNNIVFQAISLKNQNEDISEELRVFYVALTRAKQKLILIASIKDTKKITEKCTIVQSFGSDCSYLVENSNSFLEWVIICLCFSPAKSKLFEIFGISGYTSDSTNNEYQNDWDIEFITSNKSNFTENNNEIFEEQNESNNIDEHLFQKIKNNVEFKYPFENLINLPVKIAASKLSHSGEWQNYIATSQPSFMSYSNTSSTARGTAIHKFMCYANFRNAITDLNSEIDRLLNLGLLIKEEVRLLNRNLIKNFLHSDICNRIINSPKVFREHQFSVKMPLKDITSNSKFDIKNHHQSNDTLVVQGAIDCAFMEDNSYVIVDYKTDKTENIKDLYDKYLSQLQIYKYALENIQDMKVKEIGIYSFSLSEYYSTY